MDTRVLSWTTRFSWFLLTSTGNESYSVINVLIATRLSTRCFPLISLPFMAATRSKMEFLLLSAVSLDRLEGNILFLSFFFFALWSIYLFIFFIKYIRNNEYKKTYLSKMDTWIVSIIFSKQSVEVTHSKCLYFIDRSSFETLPREFLRRKDQ